jgi:hypothetical protein
MSGPTATSAAADFSSGLAPQTGETEADWIVPVGAGVGGLALLLIVAGIFCALRKRQMSQEDHSSGVHDVKSMQPDSHYADMPMDPASLPRSSSARYSSIPSAPTKSNGSGSGVYDAGKLSLDDEVYDAGNLTRPSAYQFTSPIIYDTELPTAHKPIVGQYIELNR